MELLGTWKNDLDNLEQCFLEAKPFPHVVIDGFLDSSFARAIANEFPPADDSRFFCYHNPIEKKYATKTFDGLPESTKLFEMFQSDEFVTLLKKITGIENLEIDPHLHGAGLAFHKRGGKLDMHLDYSIHPITKKERRVNLILYLNKEWNEEWGGALQLWDNLFTKCEKKVECVFNRAALFQTSEMSYHGLPEPLTCPENERRLSAGIYYVSEPRPNAVHRYKAQFFPLPTQPVNDRLKKLYEIRTTRILTKEDLDEIYPDWENDSGKYW